MAQTTPGLTPAPGTNQIFIDSTDVFYFAPFGPDSTRIRKLLGNVALRQDSTVFFCDSAYQYLDSNFIEAFSNVRIVMNYFQPDSMRRTITSHRLTFDGNTKVIDFWEDVVLTDRKVVLRTPHLRYYRLLDYAEYLLTGVITSKDNVLYSDKGYYYPKQDMAYFKDHVKLVNPSFTMVTDTLGYNTESKVAFFLAPTWVNDSVNSMYTEDGYYDTERDYAFLHQNASIGDTTYTLFADTIQYDQGRDLGQADGHLRLVQIDSSLTVFGNYGEFRSKTEATFVTDSAFAIQRIDGDTLYLFADTLATYKDTTDDKRFFMAFNHSRFLTKEMQGVCDSLVYWYDDSLMFFYQNPVLWSDKSQITGDTIKIKLRDGTIDSMSVPSSPLIVTEEDTVGYDQIKGKSLYAKFLEGKLSKMWIFGNSESIYYTKDDKENYMGMNKARCSDMFIDFKDNKPSKILFKEKPEGEFFPIHLVIFKENLLDGFVWRASERPIKPGWTDAVVYREAMRKDPLKLRLDSLLLALEDFEFNVMDLLDGEVFQDPTKVVVEDTVPGVPEGGDLPPVDSLTIDTMTQVLPIDTLRTDTLAQDTGKIDTVKGGKGVVVGKGQVKALPVLPPRLTREDRQKMNARQMRVYHRKRNRIQKELRAAEKAAKPEKVKRTFKEKLTNFRLAWIKFRKDLKEKPTKAEIEAKEKAKVEQKRQRLDRKAQRMKLRHDRYIREQKLRKHDAIAPKDADFNNVELRKPRK